MAEDRITELSVMGMHCASCVAAVERALRNVPGVQKAVVNLKSGRARITGAVTADDLIRAVTRTGYEAKWLSPTTPPSEQSKPDAGRTAEKKKFLSRIKKKLSR